METIIREISPEDTFALMPLTRQLGYELSEQQTRESINYILHNKEHCAYVAVQNGIVLGWIQAFIAVRLESKFIEISGLVVDESARGTGIGKKLTAKVCEWGADKQCETLRVRCNVKRTESHKFYEKLGFTENKQQKVFHIDL